MSTDFLLQIASVFLFVILILRQLAVRFTIRAEWPLPLSWFTKYSIGGLVVAGIVQVLWYFKLLPDFSNASWPANALIQASITLILMLLVLFLLSRLFKDPSCGCTDDDDDEELNTVAEQPNQKPKKSSLNPYQFAPPEPWSAEIAGRAAGGFALGLVVGSIENAFIANGNWMLLLLREVSILPLYAAVGTLLAWGIALSSRGRTASLWKALVGSIGIVILYWVMVFGVYPLPFLSWFIAPPAFIGAWRYIGDIHVTKRPWNPWRPKPKKKDDDCED